MCSSSGPIPSKPATLRPRSVEGVLMRALGAVLVCLIALCLPVFISVALPSFFFDKIGAFAHIKRVVDLAAQPIASRVCKDPKDTTVVYLTFMTCAIYASLFVNLWYPFAFNLNTAARAYLYAFMFFSYTLQQFMGMNHLEAHASWVGGGVVKPEWRFLFDRLGEYWAYPLCGVVPGAATYQHCLVHHKYCNNLNDPQSCLWFNRSSLFDFLFLYSPTFLLDRHFGMGGVRILNEHGQQKFAQLLRMGQIRMAILWGSCLMINPYFCLLVQLPAMAWITTLIGSSEWTMHAFLNLDDVNCTPVSATTFFLPNASGSGTSNSSSDLYFFEPWHVVHHALNSAGFSKDDKSKEEGQLTTYIRSRPNKTTPLYAFDVPVRACWPTTFAMLMRKDFDGLANAWVWTGEADKPTHEDAVKFLEKSVRPVLIEEFTPERLRKQQLVGATDLKDKLSMKSLPSA